jgi:hypothetical protein
MPDAEEDYGWGMDRDDTPAYVKFERVKFETDKAWLLVLAGGDKMWFPKSQCTMHNDHLLIVPEWLWNAKCEEGSVTDG